MLLTYKQHCFSMLTIAALILCFTVPIQASSSSSFLHAEDQGIFNVGNARADHNIEKDPETGREFLTIRFEIAPSTATGVWLKGFPADFNKATLPVVNIGARLARTDLLENLEIKVELKGSSYIQVLPLKPENQWTVNQTLIEWDKIGTLQEVVFVLAQVAGDDLISGFIAVDAYGSDLTLSQKIATSIPSKSGLIVISSLLLAGIALIVSFFSRDRAKTVFTPPHHLIQTVLFGLGASFAVLCVLQTYLVGTVHFLIADWWFLAPGILAVLALTCFNYAYTGKHLTPGRVLQLQVFVGLIAATSGSLELLQAPVSWLEIISLNHLSAALFCLLLLGANVYALSTTGHILSWISNLFLVSIPYLLSLLLLVQTESLCQELGNIITFGVLSSYAHVLPWIGRIVIVFLFNIVITQGLASVLNHRLVASLRAHLLLLLISMSVVVAPLIADLGSSATVAAYPTPLVLLIAILTTILSHAGLWAEVYVLTGMLMDAMHRTQPSAVSIFQHARMGLHKGMVYSGTFIGLLYGLRLVLNLPPSQWALSSHRTIALMFVGTLAFPLLKTIIETFDGSHGFLRRARYSYGNIVLYARGIVIGLGAAYGLSHNMINMDLATRLRFGLFVGLFASAGISLIRDMVLGLRGQGRIQTWRRYLTDALLGGFIGSAVTFYLDASQVPVVVEKLKLYTSAGRTPEAYSVYPLLNKWGHVMLGDVTGGVKLFFNEALAGVINWSVAAWLFAINRAFLTALFQRDKTPIYQLFSKEGLASLGEHTIQVLRWGLWMSPIINTFLRMMGEATWYNQDGAIRTLFAIVQNLRLDSEAFQAWSLQFFIYLLAYDFVRILIWLDHMGLRVATLVNLSFLGMDRLDEKCARIIGRTSAARVIPESVKRFTTWAPLLIPFYIPQGANWDKAWNESIALQNAQGEGMLASMGISLSSHTQLLLFVALIPINIAGIILIRWIRRRRSSQTPISHEISNNVYRVMLKDDGEVHSTLTQSGYDLSRRSYDSIDPCGRTLFLVDADQLPGHDQRTWPVVGNFPQTCFTASDVERHQESLAIANSSQGIQTSIDISLVDNQTPVEIWTVTLENETPENRKLKLVPYLEWVLERPDADRGHTQYNRLFPVMEYTESHNAVLAWQKHTKRLGILATDIAPQGFLTSRLDFIGRAQSLWQPRCLDTLAFEPPLDTPPCPSFDPIGSLLLDVTLAPKETRQVRLLIGSTETRDQALELIEEHLQPQPHPEQQFYKPKVSDTSPVIGHGEVLPNTPQPYTRFINQGNTMRVLTPFTPRPYDHAMSNAAGHYITVTNRGLHTSSSGNSQQNRLTPDWPDTVTREIPSEAFYLYDPNQAEWYSPTYHPLNDDRATYETDFSVDGTAVFHMQRDSLQTELTVFAPPEDRLGVYLLKIKNRGSEPRRLRVAPYFQIVLAGHPEAAGPLQIKQDASGQALFFKNPRNRDCPGWAFASISLATQAVETKRGGFLGPKHAPAHPFMVAEGQAQNNHQDNRPIAAFLSECIIDPHEEQTLVVTLGHAPQRKQAQSLAHQYRNLEHAQQRLQETRQSWSRFMQTLAIETNEPDFDHLQNWFKYQAVTERIWARRGFYQTSGAFGFRDQLQDTVNLIWVDPVLARQQLILHASQQFPEGDVVHWFHWLPDQRTGFANRSYASDNLLWLVWGVTEYLRMTGDTSILQEKTSYLNAELPLDPLPQGKQGWATYYFRSTREDTVYAHCIKALDLVLNQRMGSHDLPLILCGDWNDGLDEIGSEGRGESVWLGFFLHIILKQFIDTIEAQEGSDRALHYRVRMEHLQDALEDTWRDDRYLRAIHDDGTEIGIKDSGIWEIDALTAAWAVMSGINTVRGKAAFDTAIRELERDTTVLLGTPPLREDTQPYLGRSSHYPEGVRENGMYCHGDQWLIRAARILAEDCQGRGDKTAAQYYRDVTYRLWSKITPLAHTGPEEIERYGGQPNKQAADILTTFDPGRMIWNGYTGAAAWLLRQTFEGVVGAELKDNQVILPNDFDQPRGDLSIKAMSRELDPDTSSQASQPKNTKPSTANTKPHISIEALEHGTQHESSSQSINK